MRSAAFAALRIATPVCILGVLCLPALAQSPWSFDAGVKVRPPGNVGAAYVGTDGIKYGASYGNVRTSVGTGGATSAGIGGCVKLYVPAPQNPLLGVGGRICGQVGTGGLAGSVEPGVQYPIGVGPEYNVVVQGKYNPAAVGSSTGEPPTGTPIPYPALPSPAADSDLLNLLRQQAAVSANPTLYQQEPPATYAPAPSDLSRLIQQAREIQQAQAIAAQQQAFIQQQQAAAAEYQRQQQIQQFRDQIRRTMQPVYDATPQYGAPDTQSPPPSSPTPATSPGDSATLFFDDDAPRRSSTSSPQVPNVRQRQPGSNSNTASLKLGF